jgi:hypothetical protein
MKESNIVQNFVLCDPIKFGFIEQLFAGSVRKTLRVPSPRFHYLKNVCYASKPSERESLNRKFYHFTASPIFKIRKRLPPYLQNEIVDVVLDKTCHLFVFFGPMPLFPHMNRTNSFPRFFREICMGEKNCLKNRPQEPIPTTLEFTITTPQWQ